MLKGVGEMDGGENIPTSVVFQPIVDLVNGKVLGYEALGRLAGREEEGFLPLVSEAKAQRRLAAIRRQLQAQALSKGAERPAGTLLFLNMTMGQLADLRGFLANPDAHPGQIVLEIPEGDPRIDRWQARLQEFRAQGVGVAIDDWGVGTADPLRLIQLHPNWLKIDVALVRRVGHDEAVDKLLDLLVRWVNPETTHLIAEGVEQSEQIVKLRRLGIRYGQGFALGRPSSTWPVSIDIPLPPSRRISLQLQPLALLQVLSLSDDVLEHIANEQEVLAPLFRTVVADLAAWIGSTVLDVRVHGIDWGQYVRLLEHHFAQLTRGRLDETDVVRGQQIARAHQRYGIDLSYYVLGYRRLQAEVAKVLRAQQRTDLAEMLRDLFNWDISLVMQAYQDLLDRDSLTGVLTRRAFWDGVNRQIPDALRQNQAWAFGLMELEGFQTVNEYLGHVVADKVIEQIGTLMHDLMAAQYLVGRLGGQAFGLWMPHREGHSVSHEVARVMRALKQFQPNLSMAVGTAVLGPDGTTAEALYAVADKHLLQQRRPKRRPAPR